MLGLVARLARRPEFVSFGLRGTYTGLAFLVAVLLAHVMSPGELGRYFEILAWILLIGETVQAGWGPFLVREIAALREQDREAELIGMTRLAVRLVGSISIAAAAVMIVAFLASASPATMQLVWIAAPIIPLLSTSTVRQAITRGMGHSLLGQICESITRPGLQLIGLLLLWSGLLCCVFAPLAALMILLVAVALSTFVAFFLERRVTADVRRCVQPRVPPRSEWLGSLAHNALIGWSTAASPQVAVLILANVAQHVEVANFRVAQQLSLLMVLGLNSVIMVYAPDISRHFARRDIPSVQALATRGALFGLISAAPLALVYFALGRPLLAFLFGPEYSRAYLPLIVLTIGQLANAAFGLVMTMAVAARSEAVALKAQIISFCSNAILCILLAPKFGAMGAALASALSLIVWNLMISHHLRRRFGVRSLASRRALAGIRPGRD